jgi:heat shock protein HslJ
VLAYVDGRAWPIGTERDVTLTFGGRRLGGFSGCNEYGARWRVSGKTLQVGRLVATLIGCHGPSAWVERRLFAILQASPKVTKSTAQELRLTAHPVGVLTFTPDLP